MAAFSVEIPSSVLASLVLVLLVASAGCWAAWAGTRTGPTSRFPRTTLGLIPPPRWIPVGSTSPLPHYADWREYERFVKAESDRR
jgi:hypothetical protein